MPRNMINANKTIFADLDEFCASRADPILNSGIGRWIATKQSDRLFLKEAQLIAKLSYAPYRHLARFDLKNESYFLTIGFECEAKQMDLLEVDLHAGIATALLSEVRPRPIATPPQIKDIVEYMDDRSGSSYEGHDLVQVSSLFPSLRAFTAKDVSVDDTWRVFFSLCLQESGASGWIDQELCEALGILCELPLLNVPFETLCRSIFDSDPGALFLALYRCLEALYAYSSASKVREALNLSLPWENIAVVLEDQLGWHPKESASLGELLKGVLDQDGEKFFRGLAEELPATQVSVAVSNRIYSLRNSLVHYRPRQKRTNFDRVNWNVVCSALVAMVCDVYGQVFSPTLVLSAPASTGGSAPTSNAV